MTSRDKAFTVGIMWIVAALLCFALLFDRPTDGWITLMMITLIGCATAGTIAITTGTKVVEAAPAQTGSRSGKAKNSDVALVDRLISTMSEEELAALRQRLEASEPAALSDDGEIVTLAEAMGKRRGA